LLLEINSKIRKKVYRTLLKFLITIMSYKVLVLDIDGTLMNSEKKITEKTKVALRAAQEAGVTIVLASGRPTPGIVPIAKEIGLDEYGGYILSFNGAVVTNFKTGEIVFETVLPHDKIQELYDASQNYGVSIVSYKDGWIVTENVDDKYVEIEARINNMPVVKVDSFVDALTHPVTKCLMLGDGDYLEKVEVEVNNLFGDVLNIYRSEPFFLEIMPQNVDKAYSLERLLAHLNLSRDEMVACGDGFNDLSMVRYAGLGVAMGNAQQVVKEVADFVTASNDEDGLVLVVERFFR
jgi:Cof subfamily protein (haloacid dehalogenase superfamily)